MGFWGYGYFDNDGAWDFADALVKSSDLSVIEEAIQALFDDTISQDEYVAAEAIAAIATLTGLDFAYEVNQSAPEALAKNWLREHQFDVPSGLAEKARRALDLIADKDSALAQILSGTEDFPRWVEQLELLRVKLAP